MSADRLTVPQVARSIDCPSWKARRVIDALGAQGKIDVQRVGLYRTVDAIDVPRIAAEISPKRGPAHV